MKILFLTAGIVMSLSYFFISLYNKTWDPMQFEEKSIGLFAYITFFGWILGFMLKGASRK